MSEEETSEDTTASATCCDQTDPTGEVVNRPPCFMETCSLEWTTVGGRPKGTVKLDPTGGLECGDDGVRIRLGDSGDCPSPLSLDDDGNAVLDPYPVSGCECVQVESCSTGLPGGDDDETDTGCARKVCVDFENDHCELSMKVTPVLSIGSAEFGSGPVTYELKPEYNGNPVAPITSVFTSPPGGIGTYSGTVRFDTVTVPKGETWSFCVTPQARYRDTVAPLSADWGDLNLCLEFSSMTGAEEDV